MYIHEMSQLGHKASEAIYIYIYICGDVQKIETLQFFYDMHSMQFLLNTPLRTIGTTGLIMTMTLRLRLQNS